MIMKKKLIQIASQTVPNIESIKIHKTPYGSRYYAILKDGSIVDMTDTFKAVCMGVALERLEKICSTF